MIVRHDILCQVAMPIELRYGLQTYMVSPISADADSLTLEIDRRLVTVLRDDIGNAQLDRLERPVSAQPSDAQLIAMFIPAAENQITGPRLRHENEPNAEQLIAQDLKISIEELRKWKVLFKPI